MPDKPNIRRIEVHEFEYELRDVAVDPSFAAGAFYEPGSTAKSKALGIRIDTDLGVTGEYVSRAPTALGQIQGFAAHLIGKNALQRERVYNEVKVMLRKTDKMGLGPIDTALWDLAGKYYGAPIYELLGGYRTKLPAYASTYHADRSGGLDSPEAYADFAEQCLEMGYPGFKIHSWGAGPIEREVATVKAVGGRVGGKLDLMLDPCCVYDTFADAVRVGRACDDEGFFWYEDPFRDGGRLPFRSQKAARADQDTAASYRAHSHGGVAHRLRPGQRH